jgi:hypothetical protein
MGTHAVLDGAPARAARLAASTFGAVLNVYVFWERDEWFAPYSGGAFGFSIDAWLL